MADMRVDNLKELLQKRVSEFLSFRTKRRGPLRPVFRKITSSGITAYFFGGVLRDLMLHGPKKDPRDLDIVVSELTPELDSYLKPRLRKRTRFGGLEVSVGQWDLDIWDLASTWAFRERIVAPESFEDLPKTTFLDVQAIVVEVNPNPRRSRRLAENGFFRAVLHRTVDINLEDNPFPGRCVLSALTTAFTLDFALAPRLIRYVLHHGKALDLEQICSYQSSKTGEVPFGRDILSGWLKHLASCHRVDASAGVRLPRPAVTCRWPGG